MDSNRSIEKPAPPARRIVFKRKQKLTYSTAIFFLQSKVEIDDEYRRVLELTLEKLVSVTGVGGHQVGEIEVVEDQDHE